MANKFYLTTKDTTRIEAQAQCLRDKLLIRLLRRLGCRITEAIEIGERDIDFEKKFIRIIHQKMITAKVTCQKCGKKVAKKHKFCPNCGAILSAKIEKKSEPELRTLPIDQNTLDLIKLYIKKGGITVINGKRMLFNITRNNAYNLIRKCAERAGIYLLETPKNRHIHHVGPHAFRHAYITNTLSQKKTFDDARLVQEMVGHKRIDTTLGYANDAPVRLQEFNEELWKEEDR